MRLIRKSVKVFLPTKKSQVWISAVLYTLLVLVVMIIVLDVGIPIVNNLKDKAVLEDVRSTSQVLDTYIRTVASEGPGSQRIVPLNIKKGKIYASNDRLYWQVPLTTKVLEPRTRIDFGNLIFMAQESNSTVTAYESDDYCYYTLENGIIRAKLRVFGNKTKNNENCSISINTSDIIISVYSIREGKYLNANITIYLSNDPSTSIGSGYSELDTNGTFLSSAFITYYINSTNYNYDLKIGLESSSDFLIMKLEDYEKK